jgi:hypothetical protein
MPRRKKPGLLPVITGFIIIIAVVAGILFMQMFTGSAVRPTEIPADRDVAPLTPRDLDDIQANLTYIQNAFKENRQRLVLPGHLSIPLIDEDINGDGNPETIAVEFLSTGNLSDDLLTEGFQGPVKYLRVFSMHNSDSKTLLNITPGSIENSRGTPLTGQVPATHGYAFRVTLYDGEPYDGVVRLIELIILDQAGNAVSDDLTIYWKPSAGEFAATNTFGAPGTF